MTGTSSRTFAYKRGWPGPCAYVSVVATVVAVMLSITTAHANTEMLYMPGIVLEDGERRPGEVSGEGHGGADSSGNTEDPTGEAARTSGHDDDRRSHRDVQRDDDGVVRTESGEVRAAGSESRREPLPSTACSELSRTVADLQAKGYFLVPVRYKEKAPIPVGWQKETKPYTIPEGSNLGIRLGNGLVAVITNDDQATAWMTEHSGEPNVYSVRGGHWYYRAPPETAGEVDKETSVGRMELHAKGRQAVCPPSIHPSGKQYRWGRPLPPIGELPQLPAIRDLWHPAGQHHRKLLSMSAAAAHKGKGADVILTELISWRDAHLPDHLAHPDRELARMANSSHDKFHEEETPHIISAGDRGDVLHYADRIEWRTEHVVGRGEDRHTEVRQWVVVDGHLEVLDRLEIEGDLFFRVHQDAESVVQADVLRRQLDRAGALVDHSRSADALALVLRDETRGKITRARSAYGVYKDESGSLKFCTDPVPRYEEQRLLCEALGPALSYSPTADDVQRYIDLVAFYDAYEALPTLGLSVMAPFAYEVRRLRFLFPHVALTSSKTGLGKTTLGEACSDRMYGSPVQHSDGLESPYRVLNFFDAAGVPRVADEAEKLRSQLAPFFKELAEQGLGSKRGTPELGMLTYYARAFAILTAQRFPFSSRTVLVRFLISRFNERKDGIRHSRQQRRLFDATFRKLQPIGWDVTRYAITCTPTADDLRRRLDGLRDEIESAVGMDFQDSRRSQAWAVCRLGLEILEGYAASKGVEWKAPSMEEFVSQVILPVETGTFEGGDAPVLYFAKWFVKYYAEQVMSMSSEGTSYIRHKGEGELFVGTEKRVAPRRNGVEVDGTWVTEALLNIYDTDPRTPLDLRFDSFAAFVRACADTYRMDPTEVDGPDGRGRRVRFPNGTNPRCGFIPWNDTDATPSPPGGSNGGNTGTNAPPTLAESVPNTSEGRELDSSSDGKESSQVPALTTLPPPADDASTPSGPSDSEAAE